MLIDLNYRQEVATGREGLELLKQIRAIDSSLPVVVMTAYASIQLAVEAVRLGARDFLQKPWENERLISILHTQLTLRDALRGKERLEAENSVLTILATAALWFRCCVSGDVARQGNRCASRAVGRERHDNR